MSSYDDIQKARELVKLYDRYVTPERFFKTMNKVDAFVYSDAMANAVGYVKEKFPAEYRQAEAILLEEAKADKAAREKRAEEARAKRAAKKASRESSVTKKSVDAKQSVTAKNADQGSSVTHNDRSFE